ncbi:hypothetical protein WR25_26178 [Diploscapter pachys]|uniref:Uncharacterized protein n=1 Tax=Diploscapter pachys TaxID=2018661 RepID=A0A2A2J6B0_9BILA|nr:hypothetical protein WR25_26178 [Diploscapter pachys]
MSHFVNNYRQLATSILLSKETKLEDILPLLNFMQREMLLDFIERWASNGSFANKKISPLSSLGAFIQHDNLHGLELKYFGKFVEALKERIVSPSESSHVIIAALKKTFGLEAFEDQKVKMILCGILEKVDLHKFITDESPYVRATALKLLENMEGRIKLEVCEKILYEENSSEPRLICLRSLLSNFNASEIMAVISKCLYNLLEDYDMQIFRELVPILRNMMRAKEFQDGVRKELEQWREDPQIGVSVRQILGESENDQSSSTDKNDTAAEKLVEEFVAALSSHCPADEVIDCY